MLTHSRVKDSSSILQHSIHSQAREEHKGASFSFYKLTGKNAKQEGEKGHKES